MLVHQLAFLVRNCKGVAAQLLVSRFYAGPIKRANWNSNVALLRIIRVLKMKVISHHRITERH